MKFDLTDTEPVPRKIQPIIFVVDVSGSMSGKKITRVNSALRTTISRIEEATARQARYEVAIAILRYSEITDWAGGSQLIPVSKFIFQDLWAAGRSDLGIALSALDKSLSSRCLFSSPVGYMPPTIVFIGYHGACGDWKTALGKLSENEWFNVSSKIAIVLTEFGPWDAYSEAVRVGNASQSFIAAVNPDESLDEVIIRILEYSAIRGVKKLERSGMDAPWMANSPLLWNDPFLRNHIIVEQINDPIFIRDFNDKPHEQDIDTIGFDEKWE